MFILQVRPNIIESTIKSTIKNMFKSITRDVTEDARARLRHALGSKPKRLLKYLLTSLLVGLALVGCSKGAAPTSSLRVASTGLLSAALSPDGQQQLIGSFNHGGSLWRLNSDESPGENPGESPGERLFDWNHAGEELSAIQAVDFSADSRFAVTAAGQSLILWSTTSGESLRFWQSPTRITSVTISADTRYALLGQENNLAVLFNMNVGGVVGALRHEETVGDASMDTNASIALTGAADGIVRTWSLETGEKLHEWSLSHSISVVEVAASGQQGFVAADQGEAGLWNLLTGEQDTLLYKINPGITAVTFNKDESKLLVGTARERVELWDLDSSTVIKRWHLPNDGPWHKAAAIALAFREGDDGYVVVASNGITYFLE